MRHVRGRRRAVRRTGEECPDPATGAALHVALRAEPVPSCWRRSRVWARRCQGPDGGPGAPGRGVADPRDRALPHHLPRAPRGAGGEDRGRGRAGARGPVGGVPGGSRRHHRHRPDRPRRRLERLRPRIALEPHRAPCASPARPPRAGLLRRLARAARRPRARARLPPRLHRVVRPDLPRPVRPAAVARVRVGLSGYQRPGVGDRGPRHLVRIGPDPGRPGARHLSRDGAADGGARGALRVPRHGRGLLSPVARRGAPLRVRVAVLRVPARQARARRHGPVRRGRRGATGGCPGASSTTSR